MIGVVLKRKEGWAYISPLPLLLPLPSLPSPSPHPRTLSLSKPCDLPAPGRVGVAQQKLASLDVVGTTEKFDDFMISISVKLGWPLDWVT